MKLYYSPGACSMAPHIVLHASGLPFEIEKVDLKAKRTASGIDYNTINARGYVPALQLDDGEILTECPAIVQYIADLVPAARLAPAAGTLARARLQEWLNFVATELHARFGPLFDAGAPQPTREKTMAHMERRFDWLQTPLAARPYLMGDAFSVADSYLYIVLSWSKFAQIDINRWPELNAYLKRMVVLPSVQAALKAEGLIKQ